MIVLPFVFWLGGFSKVRTAPGGRFGSASHTGFLQVPRSPSSAPLPFFWGEGSPTKIDYRKKQLIPTYSHLSNLEDLVAEGCCGCKTKFSQYLSNEQYLVPWE